MNLRQKSLGVIGATMTGLLLALALVLQSLLLGNVDSLAQRNAVYAVMVAIILTFVGMMLYFLRRLILRPLLSLELRVNEIRESGDLAARIGFFRDDELGSLARSIDDMLSVRQEKQQQLLEWKTENQAILAAVPDSLLVIDAEGTIQMVREGKSAPLTRSAADLIGKNIVAETPAQFAYPVMENVLGVLEDNDIKVLEHELVVNGVKCLQESRFVALDQERVLVLIKDISARKRMEECLRETSERQGLVNAVLGILYDPRDWQQSFQQVCEKIAGFTDVTEVYLFENYTASPAERGNVYSWSRDGLHLVAANESGLLIMEAWLKLLELSGYLCMSGEADAWPAPENLRFGQLESLLVFPLCVANTLCGHIGFIEKQRRRWRTDAEMDDFYSLADSVLAILSGALERKRNQQELNVARLTAEENSRRIHSLLDYLRQSMNEVTNLLNHTGQGIFSFGADLLIVTEYSSECRRIFGGEIAGQEVLPLLFADDPEADVYAAALTDVWKNKETFRKELLLSLLPDRLWLTTGAFAVSYRVISAMAIEDQRIMVIMTDITRQLALQEEVERERAHQNTVAMVLEQQDDFLDILQDYQGFLRELADAASLIASLGADWREQLCRLVHTFKGNFAQFGIAAIATQLHQLEGAIIEETATAETWRSERMKPPLAALQTTYDQERGKLARVFGRRFLQQQGWVSIEIERIVALEKKMAAAIAGELPAMTDELKRWRYRRLTDLLLGYRTFVAELGLRTERKIAPLTVAGVAVLVDPGLYKPFIRSLIHVFRNMADHGIETPAERLLAGKAVTGRIHVDIALPSGELCVIISDDGRGLDEEKLRQVAAGQGMTVATLNDSQMADLIFQAGVSTRTAVSELSGRGIGLNAVRETVLALGGRVTVDNRPGQGVSFCFFLGWDYLPEQEAMVTDEQERGAG